MNLLRDILLSFCPEPVRRRHRPYSPSTLISAATFLGCLQFFLCAWVLIARYRHFFIARAHLWASQMNGRTEWVQSGSAAIITFEFFLYPVSLLLFYFSLEGLLRFAAGITSSEVVPSLPVVCAFKLAEFFKKRQESRQTLSLPPDQVEYLPDERIRIAAAQPKPGWNATITIGIDDRWYEVESETRASGPCSWIYVLRPSPAGKIFRRIERYQPPSEPPSLRATQANSRSDPPSSTTPVENLD